MRRQFDVNVFGAVAMIKAVLPFMRERRRGNIINITSMAGYVGLPGIPYYAGSKFALEGISEVLAHEVRGFGIKVTAVAPGAFRTDWAGRSMIRSPRSIADYDVLFDPIRRARSEKSGQQAGDPAKAARAILKVVESNDPPMHLLLGSDALKLTRDKLNSLGKEIDTWESVTTSTEYAQESSQPRAPTVLAFTASAISSTGVHHEPTRESNLHRQGPHHRWAGWLIA